MSSREELTERLTQFYREAGREVSSMPPPWAPDERRRPSWRPLLASAALVAFALAIGLAVRLVRSEHLFTLKPTPTAVSSPSPTVVLSPLLAPDLNGPRINAGVTLGNGVYGNALLLAGNEGGAVWTYYWDGASWRKGPRPNFRAVNSRPVFDPVLNKTIMITGGDMGNPLETWAWNGSSWSNLNTGLPGLTGPAILGYDVATKQLVMIAGSVTQTATSISATWIFDGARWQQVSGVVSPDLRWDANMAYDPQRRQLVLFGGRSFQNGDPFRGRTDTWTWDGARWTQRFPTVSPHGGVDSLTYDPDAQQLVLLDEALDLIPAQSGHLAMWTSHLAMWTWDGAEWHQLHPTNLPPSGAYAKTAYDSANHQLLLFEGIDGRNDLTSQTWAYKAGKWTQVS